MRCCPMSERRNVILQDGDDAAAMAGQSLVIGVRQPLRTR